MKKIVISALCLFIVLTTQAQKISRVVLNSAGITESISVSIDDAIINFSTEGNIINYGVEYFSERFGNYSRIEPYTGRLEMYATFDDKAFQGKLKYIGRTTVTYYASYELPELQGKIKSIGNLVFTYFQNFDDANLKGKIKSIGTNSIGYYASFDNEAFKGKLKTIGNTTLTYYNNFEDTALRGRIKSIGATQFTYYPSFDRQMAGSMKTGAQRQVINGINFLVN
jgi:hypothetical protein